jgi:hypothetical protein
MNWHSWITSAVELTSNALTSHDLVNKETHLTTQRAHVEGIFLEDHRKTKNLKIYHGVSHAVWYKDFIRQTSQQQKCYSWYSAIIYDVHISHGLFSSHNFQKEYMATQPPPPPHSTKHPSLFLQAIKRQNNFHVIFNRSYNFLCIIRRQQILGPYWNFLHIVISVKKLWCSVQVCWISMDGHGQLNTETSSKNGKP